VRVVGLGIGGSVLVSGLAKHGIEAVVGYEKRSEKGPSSVTSRYQNASWRAYDVAGKLVDEIAYKRLLENRQRINVTYDDGTTDVLTSDRVQIIIGSAIQSALDSARRYGADLHFGCDSMEAFYRPLEEGPHGDHCDITALFCGAHTSEVFPGLKQEMGIHEWPDLDSSCRMWLRVQRSNKKDAYCTRGGEIGTEKWHYTIESARDSPKDLERILFNLDSQLQYNRRKLKKGVDIGRSEEELSAQYEVQRSLVEKVMQELEPGDRFDYIFTNAPANVHNLEKRASAEQVVLDGGYTVEIKMATRSTVTSGDLLKHFGTDLVVCGGERCF
jgi:hypothetical protein